MFLALQQQQGVQQRARCTAVVPRRRAQGCAKPQWKRSGSKVPAAGREAGPGTLAAQQFWLQRQRVLHHEPHPSDADIIELNCGGAVMVTSRSTLRQVQGSLLSLLFDPANSHLLRHDAAGRVFLDHDPAAFGLLLRHLREMRAAAGYGCAPVVLPAIPPADAPSFRALNAQLGLGIPEDDIAAAVLRGASLPSATAPGPGGRAASYDRPSVSPHASRPAPHGASLQQQQQQQWLEQQWRQQCSPGGSRQHELGRVHEQQQQQQQQQQTPYEDISRFHDVSAHSERQEHDLYAAPAEVSSAQIQQGAAAEYDVLAPQQPQDQHHRHVASTAAAGTPGFTPSQPAVRSSPAAAGAAGADGAAAAAGRIASGGVQYSAPFSQDFYMLTSPVSDAADSNVMSAHRQALAVTVLTEGDIAALQTVQQQQQLESGVASQGGNLYEEPVRDVPLDCDIFCSTSCSKGLLSLSLVVRESAGLDNVFVGVTTPNQADQRGLQIPSFGWHQLVSCTGDTAAAVGPATETDACTADTAEEGIATAAHAASGNQQDLQQQQHWRTGDLVQLVLQRGPTNSLSLRVNSGASCITSTTSSSSSSSNVRLPAFEQWCWYLAFYRGTQVVAVVLEDSSYSVYCGDTKVKRYMH